MLIKKSLNEKIPSILYKKIKKKKFYILDHPVVLITRNNNRKNQIINSLKCIYLSIIKNYVII